MSMSSIDVTIPDGKAVEDCVKQAYLGKPIEMPVKLTIRAVSAIPRSYTANHAEACLAGLEWPSKRLDVSQVCKSLEGLAYDDIKRVAMIDAAKVYGGENKIDVKVEALCY
ncbi:putative endodeoxyribonuclease RusA [Lactobacillus phage JCL1032]|nr:RusA-like Holliday junction resolvase [Lactobacillus phage JCL1032]ACB72595.1 putative endodeoxyribonuclease RusA [Lactobacillus phage JCL1032]